ncbi:MAG: hypothetical protein KIT33_00435 [Candidatus Kapabacteria bacterium]|nr:hypothetical protein [Ignavibacteriota bacterium]MCW5883415.1 hypothetical protein [Candidatus Kapabacteria bacterium]
MNRVLFAIGMFILATLFLSSCATTETTTFVDPAFRGKQYSKICVLADISDLKYKQKLEKEMATHLTKEGVTVYTGSQLFPPTREWSEDQMQETLVNQNIEGYLLIVWKDKNVQETFKPGSSVSETKGEVKKKDGKDVYTERTVTTQTGGSVDREFRSYFEAKLFDVRSKANAWIATSYSSSGEWFGSDFDLIMESYAKDIAKNLKKDGLIR